jgi:O-antigen/teichoic acid export membrane protein
VANKNNSETDFSLIRYKRIGINTTSSIAAKFLVAFSMVVSMPLLLNYLGPGKFSVWVTLTTTLSLFSLGDFGLGNVLVNRTSRAQGKNKKTALQVTISSCFTIITIITLLVLCAYFYFENTKLFTIFFSFNNEFSTREKNNIQLVFLSLVVLQLYTGIVTKLNEGNGKSFINNIFQIFSSVFGLLGILLVVFFQLPFVWVFLFYPGLTILINIFNFYMYFYLKKYDAVPSFKKIHFNAALKLLRQGSIFFLLNIFTFIGIYSDPYFISYFLGPNAVVEYAVMQRVSQIAFIFYAFIISFWPILGEAVARGDFIWAKNAFFNSIKISVFFSLLIIVFLLCFGDQIIQFWMHKNVSPPASIKYGFCAYIFMTAIMGSVATVLNLEQLLIKQIFILIPTVFITVILKYFLCLKLGVSGSIWATVIGFSVFYTIPGYFIARKFLSFDKKSY